MRTTADLLLPDTLGPPAELPRVDRETVVPARERCCRPSQPAAARRSWSLLALFA